MRKCIIILAFLPTLSFGQYDLIGKYSIDSINIASYYSVDTLLLSNIDTTHLCNERGHVKIAYSSTSMYCEPYLEDTDSTSVLVYPACNIIEYYCLRCGEHIKELEKEERVVLWKKQP